MQPRSRADSAEEAMGANESNRDTTVSTLAGQLERWAAKLDELVAKGSAAGQEAKTEARARRGAEIEDPRRTVEARCGEGRGE